MVSGAVPQDQDQRVQSNASGVEAVDLADSREASGGRSRWGKQRGR